MGLSDQTTLERVQLKRARTDPTVARLRLSHLLSSASLTPPAMPPSAILVVRSMADPLPGRITKVFAPASLASAEWEGAAQDRLGAFYGSAARPMWGPVPSSATAVLFADYGELLACLARDLASGAAFGWWWQSILRRFPSRLPGSWAAAWAEQPLYVPAALEYLEARQHAVKVLERIAPVQAWNLLMVVLRAFDLPGLVVTRGPTGGGSEPAAPAASATEQRADNAAASPAMETAEGRTQPARVAAIAQSPWEPYLSRASTPLELGYERRALLGVGLLLRRVPQVAFTTAFASRFRAWVSAEQSGGTARAADLSPPQVLAGPVQIRDRAMWGEGAASRPRSFILPESALLVSPVPGETISANRPRASTPAEAALPAPAQPNRHAEYWRGSAPGETVGHAADQLRPSQERVADKPAETVPSTPAHGPEAGEFTRAGGILYLIHFLRRAQLLRHFDTGLGGWALIELLGRCLLDDAGNLADDAIWAALAQLDGRDPRTPPGSAFEPQRTYTAPASWLESPVMPSRFVRFRSRGIEIWSTEGFLLLDSLEAEDGVRPPGAPERVTPSRRRKLRRPARVRPLAMSVSPELRRFLHFVLPYARWRLDRALGGVRLEEALLRAGRLYVTATHVDLVMPMNEISVPVRRAGLDKNPGWVPELGRVVTFHFVQEGYRNG